MTSQVRTMVFFRCSMFLSSWIADFIALLHILADVLLRLLLLQHLAISLVQAQRRHLLFVHQDDVLAIALDKGDVRLDEPGFARRL